MPPKDYRTDHGITKAHDRSRRGISPTDDFDLLAEFLRGCLFFKGRKQFARQAILRYNATVGRQDIYPFVVPRNPQTPAQQANRMKFRAAMQAWNALTEEERAPYEKTASQRSLYGKNVFVRRFMRDEL